MSNKERGERDNVICIERPTAKDTKKEDLSLLAREEKDCRAISQIAASLSYSSFRRRQSHAGQHVTLSWMDRGKEEVRFWFEFFIETIVDFDKKVPASNSEASSLF